MAGFVASSVKGLMEQPIAFIKGLPQQFMGWGKDMIQGLIDGITGMISKAGSAIKGVMDTISSFIPHSPAKRGPFSGSGWTPHRGRAIVEASSKAWTRQAQKQPNPSAA